MHDDLRRALRRVDPPEGFADRVLERARREARPPAPAPAFPWLAKMAAAAALVLAIAGSAWYRTEERRREGEEAKRQVLMSLNLAGSKLRSIQMKVNHEQER